VEATASGPRPAPAKRGEAATKKELDEKSKFNHEAHEGHEEKSNRKGRQRCRGGFQTRPTSSASW
jgi:hypothetical protein